MSEKVLVVDDDPSVRSALSKALRKREYEVEEASSAEEALEKIRRVSFGVVLLDVNLPGMSGIAAIPLIKEVQAQTVIIVITAYDTKDSALDAIRHGAYDYFAKPFSFQEMEVIMRRALEKRRLLTEINGLREKLVDVASERIVGQSEVMKTVRQLVERIAPLESTVLITGESGTGKELVSDLIHYSSNRAAGPLVKINCAAIPEGLLESELFGYEKGAFTGAHSQKPGKFEAADNGTLLLDEIGDLSLNIQVKLLRVVEQKQVDRLGGRKPISINTRIIASTNQDLPELIKEKQFREDLYYRLNVASIHIPPLRERKEDVPLLVQHLLKEINLKFGGQLESVSSEAMEILLAHDWPGNVRELANILERAAILCRGDTLGPFEVQASLQNKLSPFPTEVDGRSISLRETLEEVERSLILDALKKSEGVQTSAARILGLSPKNLWKKIQKHAIKFNGFE